MLGNAPPRSRTDALPPEVMKYAQGTGTLMRPHPGLRSPVGHPGLGTIVITESGEEVQGSPGPRPDPRRPTQDPTVGPNGAHETPGLPSVGEEVSAFGHWPHMAGNDPRIPGLDGLLVLEAGTSSHTQVISRTSAEGAMSAGLGASTDRRTAVLPTKAGSPVTVSDSVLTVNSRASLITVNSQVPVIRLSSGSVASVNSSNLDEREERIGTAPPIMLVRDLTRAYEIHRPVEVRRSWNGILLASLATARPPRPPRVTIPQSTKTCKAQRARR